MPHRPSSRLPALLALVLLSSGCHRQVRPTPVEPDPASLRRLATGTVVGRELGEGAHGWLGIPYAQPPVGPLRWRAPRPLPSLGDLQALEFGAACPQPTGPMIAKAQQGSGDVAGDEDCLTLNVFAPRFGPEEVPEGEARLPVMFWIHGGGNTIGSSGYYADLYRLAEKHQVILVSTNYRLGLLGWFLHPALAEEGSTPEDLSGNFGTLDLLLALRWVQENIDRFGGDPGNVTVFGESAGGIDIFSLLVAPSAEGLFHKAIVQSGIPFSVSRAEATAYVDAEEPGRAGSSGEVLLEALVREGRAADREAAKTIAAEMTDAGIRTLLRGLSPEELLEGRDGPFGMYYSPNVIRDGHVLPSEPWLTLLEQPGTHHDVPLVLGTNRDEYKLFMALNDRFTSTWLFGIPRIRDVAVYEQVASAMSRTWRAVGVDRPAKSLAQEDAAPVFKYRFDWDEEPKSFIVDLSQLIGAAHGIELTMLFLNFESDPFHTASDDNLAGRREVGEAMAAYWTEFARTGRPGRGGGALPEWREAAAGHLLIDTQAGGGLRMGLGAESVETVVDAVLAAEALTQRDRCRLLAAQLEFLAGTGSWRRDGFQRFSRGRCEAWTMEELTSAR